MWPISGSGSWFQAQRAFGVEILNVLFGDTKVRSGGSGWVSGGQLVDWVLQHQQVHMLGSIWEQGLPCHVLFHSVGEM